MKFKFKYQVMCNVYNVIYRSSSINKMLKEFDQEKFGCYFTDEKQVKSLNKQNN